MDASAPPGDGEWDVINQAVKGQTIALGADGKLAVKATWSDATTATVGGGVDVDLAAVLFHEDGSALEAVFFNHTSSTICGQAINLISGDQKSGLVGEALDVQLQSIPASVKAIAFVLGSANAVPFESVSGLCVSASLDGQTSSMHCDHLTWHQGASQPASPSSVAGGSPNRHSVTLPMFLRRSTAKEPENWILTVSDQSIPGCRTFVDALPALRAALGIGSGRSGDNNFKIPIHLQKDELIQVDEAVVDTIQVGCGWDIVNDKESDTDLSAICLDRHGTVLDSIYWGKLQGFNEAIVHTGDNQTGDGDFDDEAILLKLTKLPANLHTIVFLVTNYSEEKLDSTKNVHFRLVRFADDTELVRFDSIGQGGAFSGFIPCSISRGAGPTSQWMVRCHASTCGGTSVHDGPVTEAAQAIHAALVADEAEPAKKNAQCQGVNLRGSLKPREAVAPKVKAQYDVKRTSGKYSSLKSSASTPSSGAERTSFLKTLEKKILIFLVVVFVLWLFFGSHKKSGIKYRR